MPDVLTNGVTIPKPTEAISKAGVNEMRLVGTTADRGIGEAKTAASDAITQYRGTLDADTDLDTLSRPEHNGIWALTAANTYPNAPQPSTSGFVVVRNGGFGGEQRAIYPGTGRTYERLRATTSASGTNWRVWQSTVPGPLAQEIPAPGNFDTLYRAGTYRVPAPFPGTYTGYPSEANTVGYLIVHGGPDESYTWAAQEYFQYGAVPRRWWRISRTINGDWNDWIEVPQDTGGDGDSRPGAVPDLAMRHALLAEDYQRRMGVPRPTGKAVIAFRFDHGLTRYAEHIRPLMQERGFRHTIAMNSRTWDLPENNAITPAVADTWDDVEFGNHSATHTDASTISGLTDEIVTGRDELQAQLPSHPIDGFYVPGVGASEYGGWGIGRDLHSWADYPAGRLILGYHAYSSGYIPGETYRRMDGVLRNGLNHSGIENRTFTQIKTVIDAAVTRGAAVTLMGHPRLFGDDGYWDTSLLTQVLDYVKGLVDAGTVEVLTVGESLLADNREA